MMTPNVSAASRGNLDDSSYAAFRDRLRSGLKFRAKRDGALFTTDVSGADLWALYLENFPAGPARQHHNCTACRRFIESYGGLATLGERGEVRSAVWDPADADDEHLPAVVAMEHAVRRSGITGVFLTSRLELGTAETGAWSHLAAPTPLSAIYVFGALTAGQKMAELRQDHANVMRALDEFPPELLERVVELLRSDALYRSEKILPGAEWLAKLAREARIGNYINVVWRAVATAPAGFCHPRSSMFGTLLDDIARGMDFTAAAARFRAKMHPLQYQRPQVAPTAGAIDAAEALVERLGIRASLARRFARLDEIETLWRPPAEARPAESGSVFGHLRPKDGSKLPLVGEIDVSRQFITWEKFARTVLPTAIAVDAIIPHRGNFGALVTAELDTAPPILQWDRPEQRNPVSWYVYHGGSAAEQWLLRAGQWAPVAAIALQPSMWHGGSPHHGKAAMLVVDGAKDGARGGDHPMRGVALFPEILRSDLHGVRSVIEAYSKTAVLGGYESASACGLIIGGDAGRSNVPIRVTTLTGSRFEYVIDRWD